MERALILGLLALASVGFAVDIDPITTFGESVR